MTQIGKHEFIKGQGYSLKLTFNTRKTTLYYQTTHISQHQHLGEESYYEFSVNPDGTGYNKHLQDKHIETIEAPKVRKPKVKKPTTCNRCYGAGRFEHMKHVSNGICYKCNGAGVI